MARILVKETNLKFNSLSNRTKTTCIVIHHVGDMDRDVPASEIHQWHLNNGWSGIGYHFVIRKDGTVERGRPESKIGSHCLNHNSYTIGINVVGDLEKNNPTQQQLESLYKLVADMCEKYKITPSSTTIVGHKDKMSTTCPGKNMYSKIPTVITKVKTLLGTKAVSSNSMPTLKLGSKGESVKYLQNQLKKKGYKLYTDTYGVFGEGTKKSVIQFQKDNKLDADGIVGPQTYSKLK